MHLFEHGEGDSGRVLLVGYAAVHTVFVVRNEVDGKHAPLRSVALARLHECLRVGHELPEAYREAYRVCRARKQQQDGRTAGQQQ